MKKTLLFMMAALCLISCGGDDDEPKVNNQQKETNELVSILNGKFVGSKVSESDGITETHEITFSPYSSPKKEEWMENAITKEILIYGECDFSTYFNDHLLETSDHWKYNITIAYDGAQPRLYLYPETYGVSKMYPITKLSSTSFKLDDIIYNKE